MNCEGENIVVFFFWYRFSKELCWHFKLDQKKIRVKNEKEVMKKLQDSINGSGNEDKQYPHCQMTSTVSSPEQNETSQDSPRALPCTTVDLAEMVLQTQG